MGKEIIELNPSLVWKHFYEFTQIPRPSTKEQAVIDYIVDFAQEHRLDYTIDKVGNILVRKAATAGKEKIEGVILQSHVDMVPQKNNEKEHNFETDAIETIVEGEWLTANETTLGADNGIGCAAMLAVLEDDSFVHGPLEALFTVNEEAGMEGAFGLKSDLLNGNILINLDSEDENDLFVGCAGGLNVEAEVNYTENSAPKAKTKKLIINGLKGGHSGVDIALGRANANKLLGRLLWSALENFPINIASVKGGDLRNAIPRESSSIILIPELNEPDFIGFINQFLMVVKEEYKFTEPNLNIEIIDFEDQEAVFSDEDSLKLIGMLNAAPNGVVRMSDNMPEVVETSLNLAIVDFSNGKASWFYLLRSFIDSAKYALAEQVTAFHKVQAYEIKYGGDYPGWRPNSESEIAATCMEVYEKVFNKTPNKLAMHAGLECGIIGGKYSNLDMISFGPTIRFPHSPDEKVHIESVDRFYTYLKTVLEAVK